MPPARTAWRWHDDTNLGDGEDQTPYRPETTSLVDTDGAVTLKNGRSKLAKSTTDSRPEKIRLYTYDGGSSNRKVAKGDDVLLGTFNGVPGKFSCSDDACTASTNKAGALTLGNTRRTDAAGGGVWTFTPDGDPAKIVVEGVIEDVDYLTFGYWVETTTDNVNGKTTYRVGVSHQGTHTAGMAGTVIVPPNTTGGAAERYEGGHWHRRLRGACSRHIRTTCVRSGEWGRRG